MSASIASLTLSKRVVVLVSVAMAPKPFRFVARVGWKLPLPSGLISCYTQIMNASTKKVAPKKRGRPATGKDPLVGVRLSPEMLEAIEDIALENEIPRSEAIRRLIAKGLEASPNS